MVNSDFSEAPTSLVQEHIIVAVTNQIPMSSLRGDVNYSNSKWVIILSGVFEWLLEQLIYFFQFYLWQWPHIPGLFSVN